MEATPIATSAVSSWVLWDAAYNHPFLRTLTAPPTPFPRQRSRRVGVLSPCESATSGRVPSNAQSLKRLSPFAGDTSAAASANSPRLRWADSHVRGPTATSTATATSTTPTPPSSPPTGARASARSRSPSRAGLPCWPGLPYGGGLLASAEGVAAGWVGSIAVAGQSRPQQQRQRRRRRHPRCPWGEGAGEESVPEPTTAVSLLLGLLTVAAIAARHRT